MAGEQDSPELIPDHDYVRVHITGNSGSFFSSPTTREQILAWIEQDKGRLPGRTYELSSYPTCLVCGAVSYGEQANRCHRHLGRTPCAIDGCTKSRKFENGCWDDARWVCGIHWREVCPPHSPLRRTYNRFFRIARRLGVEKSRWPVKLERRFWRFFRGLVARYHRRIDGYIDVDEINKLFGWTE